MPLEIVKSLANSERPKCDIEFIDIQNDRLFTSSEGGNVKVRRGTRVAAGPSYNFSRLCTLLEVFKVQIFFEFDCLPTEKM
jgi:hypothetical protein